MIDWKHAVDETLEFIRGIEKRRVPTYAASGAYYLFMSLVPLALIVCAILPYTPLTQDLLLDILENYVPVSMYELVDRIVSYVYDGAGAALSLSILLAVWSASAAMLSLMRGMDVAYDAVRWDNYIVFRLRGCFFMVIIVSATLVSLCAMVYGNKIINLLQEVIADPWFINTFYILLRYGRYLILLFILTLTFALLYKWMPARKLRLRNQWKGAIFTSAAWVVFSAIFSVYVAHSNKFGIYGIIGTIMMAMIWMYFCLFFLLLGAYINRHSELRKLRKQE